MGDRMKKKITIISFLAFLIDQIVKVLMLKYITIVNLIPGFLSFMVVKNKGVAFSMFWGNRWFIIIFSIFLVLALIWFLNNEYICKKEDNFIKNIEYGILFGGIFGNLFDRIIRGYVVDYISLNFFGYSFPIFNLADIFITFGVLIMLFYSLFEESLKKNK